VQFSVADIDKRGDIAPQVQKGMELDGTLGFSEMRLQASLEGCFTRPWRTLT
jgi:hypothetical protein